ncbi:hypothetical protein CP97_14857 [Aurantiacibacter atlanticus]|uniref:Uncharacterized protein n=1 Tax=Aurantiacibacter atlanticus TaxID=1648404 RepID=A0A168M3K9_9SPHN|nr:hypothetical protein CP97_14857 [Aurantiacibacter atlanticus]
MTGVLECRHRDAFSRRWMPFSGQIQSTGDLRWWIGRVEHRIRRVDGELKIARKRVELINSKEPVPALAFLI